MLSSGFLSVYHALEFLIAGLLPRWGQGPLSAAFFLHPEWKGSPEAGDRVDLCCTRQERELELSLLKGSSRTFFTARIEGPPFHRGASESKKNGPVTPFPILLRPRIARTRRVILSPAITSSVCPSTPLPLWLCAELPLWPAQGPSRRLIVAGERPRRRLWFDRCRS